MVIALVILLIIIKWSLQTKLKLHEDIYQVSIRSTCRFCLIIAMFSYIYTCGLDHKYRVLVSVVCLSVCLCVSTITQKINGLGS